MLSAIHHFSVRKLEACLLPNNSLLPLRVGRYALQALAAAPLFAVACLTYPFGLRRTPATPLDAFSENPTWQPTLSSLPVPLGVATAEYQVSGADNVPGTWAEFERKHPEAPRSGVVHDFWNHPERLIEKIKELGVEKYRFSVERSLIEPMPGHFNEIALARYRALARLLRDNGIEPFATLHHFNDPLYFASKGGFEKEENIAEFVRYAEKVVDALSGEVKQFATFNEPTVYAFNGYGLGFFPPEKPCHFRMVGTVLGNLCKAHSAAYAAIKARHPDVEVGIAHNILRFRPYHRWNPLERIISHYITEMTHSAAMRFFQTGEFRFQIPFSANIVFKMPKPPMDFFGLQYYTDPLLKTSFTKGLVSTCRPGETMTPYEYRSFPQGLASALEECRALRVPIDITETGIDSDDAERIRFHDRIFQTAHRALREGIPLRAIYLWTLLDNYEWHKAWAIRYGLYSFDPKTQTIAPRPVALWLQGLIRGGTGKLAFAKIARDFQAQAGLENEANLVKVSEVRKPACA